MLCLQLAGFGSPLAAETSPYAGEEERPLKAMGPRQVEALREGRGMGLARAAELNRYPGPMHVLELAEELALTEPQYEETEALRRQVKREARRLGRLLLRAERRMEAAFQAGTVEPAEVDAWTAWTGQLRGRLRAVHLKAHVRQRALLSEDQIALYDELRGY